MKFNLIGMFTACMIGSVVMLTSCSDKDDNEELIIKLN